MLRMYGAKPWLIVSNNASATTTPPTWWLCGLDNNGGEPYRPGRHGPSDLIDRYVNVDNIETSAATSSR